MYEISFNVACFQTLKNVDIEFLDFLFKVMKDSKYKIILGILTDF